MPPALIFPECVELEILETVADYEDFLGLKHEPLTKAVICGLFEVCALGLFNPFVTLSDWLIFLVWKGLLENPENYRLTGSGRVRLAELRARSLISC